MADQETRTRRRSSMGSVGILLIVAGIVILALQYVHIDMSWLPNRWAELTWPLRIIIPGLALFIVGLMLPDRAGEGLSGFGLVAAAAGVLLWYQAVTGTWASWAYAWALVLPAAGGLASIIHGMLHANWRHVRDGLGGLAFGLVAFVVLGYVFEGWLGFTGFGLNRIAAWVPGVILLAVGITVLFIGTPGEHSSRRAEREQRHIEREQRWAERRGTSQGWTSAPVVPPDQKKMETIMPVEPTTLEDKKPQ
jgi:hypothetical protein